MSKKRPNGRLPGSVEARHCTAATKFSQKEYRTVCDAAERQKYDTVSDFIRSACLAQAKK